MTSPAQPRPRLVAALFGALKLTQLYGRRHDATAEALASLDAALREARGETGEELRLTVRGGRLVVDDRTMRAAECGSLALGFLCGAWLRRGIETVRIGPDVTRGELGAFLQAFLECDQQGAAAATSLVERLDREGLAGFTVEERVEREDEPALLEERRQAAMRTYLGGLRAFRDVLRTRGAPAPRTLRRARRAVHSLVDRFLEDEPAVLALAQIRAADPKLFHHSLNVCIYSLALGQRLGMNRRQLGELGLAALFHDLGKTLRDGPGTGTVASGAATQWKRVRGHPGRGARLLLDTGGTQESMLKAAIAAYEHHVHHDGSGFPAVDHAPHLVSRIVAIADCYEALRATRSYRETPYTAWEAFALMFEKAGTMFDPLLLKVFVCAMGMHPIGELVELTSGEVAVVSGPPADAEDLRHPRVRVVESGGGQLEPGTIVDLGERDAKGAHLRGIARTLAPHEIFDDAAEYVGEFVGAV